jgi:parvulin-like peptidyl-prolyl isomerase
LKRLRFSVINIVTKYAEARDLSKKKVEKPRREFTRHQLTRWQQQKRRQRIIFGSAMAVIVAVLAIVGVGIYQGWYVPQYQPLHETVIEVNGTEFDMAYYIDTLEYYLDVQGFPSDQLGFIAGRVVEVIQENELVRQAAMELGITVSDDEVNEQLASEGLPMNAAYQDMVRRGMLEERLLAEYFDPQVPQYAPQRHVMAMFLESESQANEVIARLEAGEDFGTLASELSLEGTSQAQAGDLGWLPAGILTLRTGSFILDEAIFSLDVGVLSQPIYESTRLKGVGYWLVEVTERDMETGRAWVMMMLLSSEEEAYEVIARLEAGEDFAALVEEFSQHDASRPTGGVLEIASEGQISSTFYQTIFAPDFEVGVLSGPIRDEEVVTSGGYWVVEVLEEDDNRPISEDDRELVKTSALGDWVDALWDDPDNNVQSYLDEEKIYWAISYIIGG